MTFLHRFASIVGVLAPNFGETLQDGCMTDECARTHTYTHTHAQTVHYWCVWVSVFVVFSARDCRYACYWCGTSHLPSAMNTHHHLWSAWLTHSIHPDSSAGIWRSKIAQTLVCVLSRGWRRRKMVRGTGKYANPLLAQQVFRTHTHTQTNCWCLSDE